MSAWSPARFAGRMFVRSVDPVAEPANELALPRPLADLKHVAIIMDGNGRWAEAQGVSRLEGHRQGVEAARRALDVAKELSLTHLTLYSFSTENWQRPDWEVQHLLGLLRQFFERDLAKLAEEGVRVRILGARDTLPDDIREMVEEAEARTRHNQGYTLQIAFNYGGRDEIVRAVAAVADQVANGTLSPGAINEEVINQALDTGDAPDPDLIIRTSGEQRISNFLLWQAAYAEFIFLDCYWPDFDRDQFLGAVETYAARQRRFGARP